MRISDLKNILPKLSLLSAFQAYYLVTELVEYVHWLSKFIDSIDSQEERKNMQKGEIVRFFIASPGDVPDERETACKVIHRWNAANSLDRSAIIEPVRLETHAQLAQGDHPQNIIDHQLLDRCSVLVAIFWSKLGTPTKKHESGTVQEIKEFIRRHGPDNVMLFFCGKNVPIDTDQDELKRLKTFKKSIQSNGLYSPAYNELPQFESQLSHQVDLVMNRLLRFQQLNATEGTESIELSNDEKNLIRAAIKSKSAQITADSDLQGYEVNANGKSFCEKGSSRSEARWKAVIKSLTEKGLIEQKDRDGYIFGVTERGFSEIDSQTKSGDLSELQSDYLRTIGRPRNNGSINAEGLDDARGRDAAKYQEAITVFENIDFMKYSGGQYIFTPLGWKAADGLWELKILDALEIDKLVDDATIAENVELTDGKIELEELHRHLSELEDKNYVTIEKARGSWHARLTHAGSTYSIAGSVDLTEFE